MGYNKITLYGKQTCDYLHIQNSEPSNEEISYVDSEPKNWGDNTLLLSAFNNNLDAGDSTLTEKVDGYEVRRRNGSNPYSEYVCTIKEGGNKYIIDYLTKNNSEYSYYLYPSSSNDGIVLSPFVTESVFTDWDYWSLLVVDETDTENLFYVNKIFKFELNFSTNDLNNNSSPSVTPNFTRYPTIQHNTSNYWSGSLSALYGYVSCNDCDFIQTPNMMKELKSLNSETRKMFLKDFDGNIWEVKLSDSVSISTENKTVQKIKTVNISWVEVGNAEGISIINNPALNLTNWVLTETGELVEYKEYIWDEQYRWDNSYIWTAHDNILGNDINNIGRELV